MNLYLLNKAIDLKTYEICRAATPGEVQEIIDKLKPHINIFDYNNVVQAFPSSQTKMQYIIDIIQKGKSEAIEIFMQFLFDYHIDLYNFIKDYANGRIDRHPRPEANIAQYAYRYSSGNIPRVSQIHDDNQLTNGLNNMTLSNHRSVHAEPTTNDVHSAVVRPQETQSDSYESYKSSVKSLFNLLSDSETTEFKQWLRGNGVIEAGTLSRCTNYEELEYELEKRDSLVCFIEYSSYPEKLIKVVKDVQFRYRQIEKIVCKKCSRKLIRSPYFLS